MVVRLVFEQEKPGLRYAVYFDLDLYGAGVYFVADVEFAEPARRLEILCGEGADIHKAYRLGAPQLLSRVKIPVVGALEKRVVEGYAVYDGVERGVAAVIRPVGVDDADFGYGWVAVFRLKICLAEGEIVAVHRETVGGRKFVEAVSVEGKKAVENLDLGGKVERGREGGGLFHRGLARLNGVDDVFLDRLDLLRGDVAVKAVDLGRVDKGTLALGDDLYALGGAVRPLVKLTGEIFHREDRSAVKLGLVGHDIKLWLGENSPFGVFKQLLGDVLNIVAVEDAHPFQSLDPQKGAGLAEQRGGLVGKSGLFFDENSVYHESTLRYGL